MATHVRPSEVSQSQDGIFRLPSELLDYTLDYCENASLFRLLLVCRLLNAIVNQSWKRRYERSLYNKSEQELSLSYPFTKQTDAKKTYESAFRHILWGKTRVPHFKPKEVVGRALSSCAHSFNVDKDALVYCDEDLHYCTNRANFAQGWKKFETKFQEIRTVASWNQQIVSTVRSFPYSLEKAKTSLIDINLSLAKKQPRVLLTDASQIKSTCVGDGIYTIGSNQIENWDIERGSLSQLIKKNSVNAISFLALQQKDLVAATQEGEIELWDFPAEAECLHAVFASQVSRFHFTLYSHRTSRGMLF